MRIARRDDIIIRDRQRKKFLQPPLNELKERILARGLLHPPVCFEMGDGKLLLVAGERRSRAIDMIAKEGKTFLCDGTVIKPGEYPYTLSLLETELERQEAELDENVVREDLTWQEKAEALSNIYKLRLAADPKTTATEIGRELVSKGAVPEIKNAIHMGRIVRESVLISEHLDDPVVNSARNATEAHSLILKKQEEKINAIIAQRRIASMPGKPDVEIRHGDLEVLLPALDPAQFDLIVADPPYGMDADSAGFRARTVHHHNYEDDFETARRIAKSILVEGFRITHPRANIFLFTDIKHWDWLQRLSASIGWSPFRRPLIWGKSDGEGLAPWGAQGPRITTEFIFYATKGAKGLLSSPIDYQRINRVPRSERIHAAEKPVELIRNLLECSTLPGDRVLDPCCGSGSTLVACREMRRKALGIEKEETYFNTAMSNVFGGDNAIPVTEPAT